MNVNEWWRGYGEFYLQSRESEYLDAAADTEAEAAWKLLGLDAGARVLDAACGFGRHAVRLASWGFDVWGVDVDVALIDEARRRASASGIELRLDEADLRRLPVPDGWAQAVLNVAGSAGLFEDDADNRQILAEAFRVLTPGGRMLVETNHRDRVVLQSRHPTDWEERDDGSVVLRKQHFDSLRGRLDAELTVVDADGRRTTLHERPRVYSLTELIAELRAVGFETVTCFGGWQREPPAPDRRAVIVASKPG